MIAFIVLIIDYSRCLYSDDYRLLARYLQLMIHTYMDSR